MSGTVSLMVLGVIRFSELFGDKPGREGIICDGFFRVPGEAGSPKPVKAKSSAQPHAVHADRKRIIANADGKKK